MDVKKLLLLSLFLSLISCSNHHFSDFQRLGEDHRWQKKDAKVFEFEITDDAQSYNLIFDFSHIHDYQFASVPIDFNIENPTGKSEKFTVDLKIRDNDGKELADCTGDICDLKYTFKDNVRLEKGKYKITISHNFNGPYLPNILGIGLIVESAK